MADVQDESGGGVMLLFSADPVKQPGVENAMEYTIHALRQQNLMIEKHTSASKPSKPSFLVVNASRSVMEAEAEHIKLMKEDLKGSLAEFKVRGAADTFKSYNDVGFFTASEQALLVRSLVDEAQGGEHVPPGVRLGSCGVVYALREAGLITEVMQAHRAGSSRTRVWLNCLYGLGADVEGVNRYFGPEMAFYFAWMDFYLRWLLVPAVVGALISGHKTLTGHVIDDHPYTPFYSLTVVLWGALFQKYWKRTAEEWSWRFGTALAGEEEVLRPEFKGTERISPITGERERWYPTWKRLQAYAVSAVVTLVMLVVALLFMICSLNLQGYMVLEDGDTTTPIESWFYISWLSKFAEREGLFDATGYFRGCIPCSLGATVVHVICIQALNKAYRSVAERLTEWENHRTEEEHENALMTKRFLFEAFDCYISLFYLAFVQYDMDKLKWELISLYTVDTFRRIATECLVPMISQLFAWSGTNLAVKAQRRFEVMAPTAVKDEAEVDQIHEEEYDSFDDYLEMVIQYGYISLFASAFPLASAISLLSTFVEIKSDMFKLLFLYKRPVPRRTGGIGNWQLIMDATTLTAVATNCLLFTISSEQLMQWVPQWYMDMGGPDSPADQQFELGKGRYVLGLCFAINQVLLAMVGFLWVGIPSMPRWVRQKVSRVHYLRERGARAASMKKHD